MRAKPGETYLSRIETKRTRRRRLKRISFAAAFLFIVASGMYLIKESPWLRVSLITVAGTDDNARTALLASMRETIRSNAVRRFLGENHFFAWPDEASPPSLAFARVSVTKNWWTRSITIIAEPRTQFGIWCNEKSAQAFPSDTAKEPSRTPSAACHWFDDSGFLFGDAPETAGQLIPRITEEGSDALPLGETVLPSEIFQHLQAILSFLKGERITVSSFRLMRPLAELHAAVPGGAVIRFSIRDDPSTTALPALHQLLETERLANLNYIDLTVPDKVFLNRRAKN